MKATIFLLTILLISISVSIKADEFSGNPTIVSVCEPVGGTPYYIFGGPHDIGYRLYADQSARYKSRAKFQFDLYSIPSNATINSVSLNYSVTDYDFNGGPYYFRITEIGNYNFANQIYDNIGQAESLFEGIQYSFGNLGSNDLTSLVNQYRGGYMYLGVFSENESSITSYANISLSLSISYTLPPSTVNITVKNNFLAGGGFNHGVVLIDGESKTIPLLGYGLSKTEGQNFSLGAVSPQNDNENHQMIWHTGQINQSCWMRENEVRSFDQNFSFNVTLADDNQTYTANMRKNYVIMRNYQTEFDGTSSPIEVARIVEENSGQISTPVQQTINNRTYSFAGWSDGVRNNPRTITPANNSTFTGLYKLPLFTNNSDGFQTNNQRKFIRTHNYELIRTYSSMNRIWLEKSTDNGTSWSLLNLGSSISGTGADYPSLVQIGQSLLLIVYLEDSIVKAVLYDLAYEQIRDTYLIKDIYVGGGIPVVTASRDGLNNFMVVWNEVEGGEWYPGGLHYFYGKVITGGSGYPVISEITAGLISGTTGNSVNPAIGIRITGASYPLYYHLAWEEGSAGSSVIKYCKITGASDETLSFSAIQTISTGSGYTINRNPSIIADNGTEARVCWQGYRSWSEFEKEEEKSGGGDMYEEWRVVFRATDNNYFWNFGNNVNLPVISRNDGWSYYSIVWSENSGGNLPVKFADNTLSTVRQTNIQGRDVMLSNGTNSSSMYVNTINRANSPFGLLHSSSLGSFYKPNSVNIATGREGILQKDEAEFYFMLGDVLKDGEVVNFKKIEVGEQIGDIRGYLETEEIEVNNQSQLECGVQYGIKDTSKARTLFNDGLEIEFGIELIDSENGEVIGNFNEVNFNTSSAIEYKVEGYQLNMSGIGDRRIKLRLKAIDNRNCNLTLSTKYSDETVLSKKSNKQISYNGDVVVTDYSLSQNYPNPFNPVTTIKYQLPANSKVTLTIYDILGKEVTKLVDKEQEAGNYQITFDAKRYASGVYICRIIAGDFVKTIKMSLVK